jgi:hypothetical protein
MELDDVSCDTLFHRWTKKFKEEEMLDFLKPLKKI